MCCPTTGGVWYFAPRDTDGAQQAAGLPGDAGTTTSPAAAVPDGQAQCVRKAECWSGWVMIDGEINSVRKLSCEQGHIWEVLATAVVPGDAADPYQDVLAEPPVVRRVCSMDALLASRFGDAPRYGPERWEFEVLPPSSDDVSRDLGVYRCVGRIADVTGTTGPACRPR